MSALQGPRFVVVGAGLGGSLMAALLAREGYAVELVERRADPRLGPVEAGRSINLAISARGLHALDRLGLADQVLAMAVPLYGRVIHSPTGHLAFQPYGTGGQAINSVSRADLNLLLVTAAERAGARTWFGRRCTEVDVTAGTVTTVDAATDGDPRETARGGIVVGADGAFSAVRAAMQRRDRYDYCQTYLEHAYKELHIPPGPEGAHVLEKNALHIWPRGGFMMMAMGNRDGSFTVTLYLPVESPFGFDRLGTPDAVRRFFEEQFPDAVPLIPGLLEDFFTNPTGSLLTIRSRPWHAGGTAVLLGDAAHAIVPFYGQGANAAFEDCLALLDRLRAAPGDAEGAFRAYETERKPNAEAIADLALENFREMRDHVASPLFLARKRLEKLLHSLLPRQFLPLYGMIAFSLIPYAEAKARAERQGRIMRWIGVAIVAGMVLGVAALLRR